jgi:DNA repair exonuclease SbcCD ATPase subunit
MNEQQLQAKIAELKNDTIPGLQSAIDAAEKEQERPTIAVGDSYHAVLRQSLAAVAGRADAAKLRAEMLAESEQLLETAKGELARLEQELEQGTAAALPQWQQICDAASEVQRHSLDLERSLSKLEALARECYPALAFLGRRANIAFDRGGLPDVTVDDRAISLFSLSTKGVYSRLSQ